ncbi:unnamed protein product [Calicophoron daubneyi]|uniref:Polycystic kidney disease 2-like 1 protein n=1 Tax=Calicophoron daubneyi TaxID=300641 RepID=A0AAV2TJA8_CALDB
MAITPALKTATPWKPAYYSWCIVSPSFDHLDIYSIRIYLFHSPVLFSYVYAGEEKTVQMSYGGKKVNYAFDGQEFANEKSETVPDLMMSYDSEVNAVADYGDKTAYNSCWKGFLQGLRRLWATRLTEDMSNNQDLYIRTTLRELILYVLFIVCLMIVAFGPVDEKTYFLTSMMKDAFLGAKVNDTTLSHVNSLDDLWMVIRGPIMDSWYESKWYNSEPMWTDNSLSVNYDNHLIGVPRIRQLRMSNKSCLIPEEFQSDIKECFGTYSKDHEDKQPFGLKNGTAWTYTTPSELEMSFFVGDAAVYGGGGFYEDLSRNRTAAENQLAVLFDNLWLDRGTRAVVLHFTAYNPNLNLFCVVEIMIEVPGSGGLLVNSEFRTVKLIRYVTTFDYFIMACEILFLLFICYYTVEEILEIAKNGLSYFTSIWSWLDIVVIVISTICAVFNIYRYVKVNEMLVDLLKDENKFANFQFLSFWQMNFNYGIALTVFLAWIKIFKYVSFSKTLMQMGETLSSCAKDLVGFAVMFFIIFFAFAELGYLAFGTQVDGFRRFTDSVYTLFRIILGDFDFDALERANAVFGPIYFIVYVFYVFFILINMFIGIINEAYSAVKGDLDKTTQELEVKDFFKKRMKKMLEKMKHKKNKIERLQTALDLATEKPGESLQCDEMRERLKKNGFSDEEIDSVLGRFDTNKDQVLSRAEQLKMQAQLEEEKMALMGEIAKEEQISLDPNAEPSQNIPEVTQEEFTRVLKRVGRIEGGVSVIMQHLQTVLNGLSAVEKAKIIRREAMTQLLETVVTNDTQDREQDMEDIVNRGLEKYDNPQDLDKKKL